MANSANFEDYPLLAAAWLIQNHFSPTNFKSSTAVVANCFIAFSTTVN